MWIYPGILLAVVFFLFYKYITRNYDYWKKRTVFYLEPVPFFGHMLDLIQKENPLGLNMLKLWNAAGNRDYFGIFAFGQPSLILTSPKIVKDILQKDFSNFNDRNVSPMSKHPVMSNMLFFQRNPLWKDVRSKLTPIFTSGKLKLMYPIMVKESEKMNEYISKIANIPDVETKEICAKFSTNVITRCAFAVDANSFENDDAIFRKLGRQVFDFRFSTALRQVGNFFAPEFFNRLNIPFADPKITDMLGEIFADVLRTRKASESLKGNDFVDILLEANRKNGDNGFSEKAMLGQAIQFFGAAFETVSSTLSFSLYELCVNPDIQDKLRSEINTHLKDNNEISYEVLQEMKYLDMCISETLRKYPPVQYLDRICNADYKIEGSSFVLEKGIPVIIPMYALHYNPKYFPDPERYDPERFADKTAINTDGLSYAPFGDGPRICIGQRFGLLEAKRGLVSILSKYRLEKSAKTPVPIKYASKSIVLQSEIGIPLKFVSL